jgi:predicted transcriptional regulator of viral defense system
MAIQEYLETHHVFSAADFAEAFPGSHTDRNLLTRAVTSGRVDHPKRGLYVSKTGPYSRVHTNPLDVASKACEDAVFCFLTALQIHGVLHNITQRNQFYTAHKVAPFTYDGQDYSPVRRSGRLIASQGLLTSTGHRYQVTTTEQTLVDCLDRPNLAGGPENLLRSIGGFRYLDLDKLMCIAENYSASLRARLGWVLETKAAEWDIDDDVMKGVFQSLGSGPYYFYSSKTPKDTFWASRWKLYLPFPNQEMASWLNE